MSSLVISENEHREIDLMVFGKMKNRAGQRSPLLGDVRLE